MAELILCSAAFADETIKVSSSAWEGLTAAERASIQSGRLVEVRDTSSFGLIVDTQGIDESTPATSGGAALGAAVGNAAYVDHALQPRNSYSAKTELAATLLGGVLGSALDRPAVQQFHFRYGVKTSDGEIRFLDSIQPNAFRIPAGICVSIPEVLQIPQSVCQLTSADLRRIYLPAASASQPVSVPTPIAISTPPASGAVAEGMAPSTIRCKVGNLTPVPTSSEKCLP